MKKYDIKELVSTFINSKNVVHQRLIEMSKNPIGGAINGRYLSNNIIKAKEQRFDNMSEQLTSLSAEYVRDEFSISYGEQYFILGMSNSDDFIDILDIDIDIIDRYIDSVKAPKYKKDAFVKFCQELKKREKSFNLQAPVAEFIYM